MREEKETQREEAVRDAVRSIEEPKRPTSGNDREEQAADDGGNEFTYSASDADLTLDVTTKTQAEMRGEKGTDGCPRIPSGLMF